MAVVKPFAALRPDPQLAARICSPPYDVLSSEEARRAAGDNPISFLHVSKPEIDLPPTANPYSREVYATGKANFDRLISEGTLRQDAKPNLYLYRQIAGAHSQTGLVACVWCEDYLQGTIKKHELTRPEKEDDRVQHVEALNAQTGPAFLVYPAIRAVDEFVAAKTSVKPEIDFTAEDGVRHTSWTISDTADIAFVESEFARLPSLYIADGHHRSAAAVRVYLKRKKFQSLPAACGDLGELGIEGNVGEVENRSGFFLSVIFPQHQMRILPYNRVLKDLNGFSPEQLLDRLDSVFAINTGGPAKPHRKHELAMYLRGTWYTLLFRPRFITSTDPVENLDVTLLQRHVLDPIFGVADPRTSERIHFVGGIRGTEALAKQVDDGEFACAFSLFPTGIEDLMTIADAGGIMPPKSTWFEPKLRDAMFCHLLGKTRDAGAER